MVGYLWIFAIVVSIIVTVVFASHFNLKRIPHLTILNILCPFAGLLYAMYVVHYVVPRVVKQEYGQDIESPLQPYIDHYSARLKEKWAEITGSNNNDDKTL